MRKQSAKTIAAILIISGALVWLHFQLHPSPPGVERKLHEALGRVLAEEAAKRLGQRGQIILIARDTSVYPNAAADSQLDGFHRALRTAKLAVASTNLIKFDPLRVVRVPPGDYYEILRKQSDTNVIVSFLGPPVLTDDQLAKLGQKRPRVVALCTGAMPAQSNLRELLAKNLVEAAIVSRPNPPSARPASISPEAWFQQYYQVVTAANSSDVPGANGGATR